MPTNNLSQKKITNLQLQKLEFTNSAKNTKFKTTQFKNSIDQATN